MIIHILLVDEDSFSKRKPLWSHGKVGSRFFGISVRPYPQHYYSVSDLYLSLALLPINTLTML